MFGSTAAGPLDRLDPRMRILLAAGFSVLILTLDTFSLLFGCLFASFILCVLGGVPRRVVGARLAALNLFMVSLVALLPFGAPGQPVFALGPFFYSEEGFFRVARIALRGNTIVLSLTAFLAIMDPVVLGQALRQLHFPQKLIQLFMLTVRYITVLEREYRQLRLAMRVRAFTPRLDIHTLRSFGHLTGMLLVRALDRSERINAAMRCRGFAGVYPIVRRFSIGPLDAVAAGLFMLAAAGLWWVDGP